MIDNTCMGHTRTHLMWIMLAVFVTTGIAACARTEVGFNFYYPLGSSHDSAQYRLAVTIAGAPGKAYVDPSPKEIAIYIRDKSSDVLLESRFIAHASDLACQVGWDKEDTLDIIFYEQPSRKEVFAVHLMLDAQTRKFVGRPVAPIQAE